MKKARITPPAAVVVDEEGKEFEVRHGIDVREWLDAGYTLKGAAKIEPKDEDEDEDPELDDPELDPENDEPEELTDAQFMESVKGQLHDLNAETAKRVAKIVGVEYTNKKDTMNLVEDKLAAEDL